MLQSGRKASTMLHGKGLINAIIINYCILIETLYVTNSLILLAERQSVHRHMDQAMH